MLLKKNQIMKIKISINTMKKLFSITIVAACSLAAIAGKPRVKKATKKTVVTQQKKQTATKRDTIIIKFNLDSVADAPEGAFAQ